MRTAREVRRTSVIAPTHKPLFLQPIKDDLISTEKRSFPGEAELDLPGVFLPRMFFPPLPRQTPWPRSMYYLPGVSFPADFCGMPFIECDVSGQRRAEIAKTDFCFLQFFWIFSGSHTHNFL